MRRVRRRLHRMYRDVSMSGASAWASQFMELSKVRVDIQLSEYTRGASVARKPWALAMLEMISRV